VFSSKTNHCAPPPFSGTAVRVARSQKIKKTKFGHKQFQKGQILKNEKRPNKGQISCKKF
jgi:hypothetical protein